MLIDYRLATTGPDFVIQVENNSTVQLDFVCFQPVPPNSPGGTHPLAWFAQSLAPRTSGYFVWQVVYGLIWAETGPLSLNQVVRVGQYVPADPGGKNSAEVTLSRGAYRFGALTAGAKGTLSVRPDQTIPARTLSIGIGMSGQATHALQAHPNLPESFAPREDPRYRIAFSSSRIETGQTLAVQSLSSTSQAIVFPPNQYGAVATLDSGNSWSVRYQTSLVVRRLGVNSQ